MKKILTIIIIGYNEEKNIPYLFESLQKNLSPVLKTKVYYIDQSSSDDSVSIAKNYGAEVYIHENKGYADPDKKRAVDNLCEDDDRVFIIDADERISSNLAKEITTIIREDIYDIIDIKINIHILGGPGQIVYQPRLFKKSAVKFTEEIHNYIQSKSRKITKTKESLENIDYKLIGHEISSSMNKYNTYSEKELDKLDHLSKLTIIRRMFWMPLLWFFGHGIIHRQFLRGIPGLIVCSMMAHYQRLIYAKLYERKYVKY